jgi:hypothetical protein
MWLNKDSGAGTSFNDIIIKAFDWCSTPSPDLLRKSTSPRWGEVRAPIQLKTILLELP